MNIKMNKDKMDLLSIISSTKEEKEGREERQERQERQEREEKEEPELLITRENEAYLKVSENKFEEIYPALAERKFSLIGLFCAEAFEKKDGFTLFYAFKQAGREPVLILVREIEKGKKAISIAEIFPSASWFEREIRDGFGLEFAGAFDTRRLFLHECYPEGFHPLRKAFKNGPVRPVEASGREYKFRQVKGEGVYQIPVGPVHAGIIEPGHFRFSVIGEPIFSLEIRLFYKHRGIEKLAEGKSPSECVALAEAVSGDESIANAIGFCMAVERICGTKVPERAERLRAIMLELERIYSLLGDLAGMAVDVGFALVASPFFILREEVLRENEKLTGSRFLRGIAVPGGLKKDIPDPILKDLPVFLEKFSRAFESAYNRAMSSSSLIDRFATTGIIKRELVSPLNLTGPLARASGCPADTRLDRPYGAYRDFAPEPSVRKRGDVLSRFEVKTDEIRASVALILRLAENLPLGPIFAESTGYAESVGHNSEVTSSSGTTGYSLALIEAPRGQNLHWVYLKNGLVDRYKIRTASFCNWQAIEHAVLGNIVPDFPLINKSLNLSYAGTDL